MKERLKKILTIVVIVIVAVGLTKNIILKPVVSIGAGALTGTKVTIGQFKLSVLRNSVQIKDFKVHNPKGFEKAVMADIPEIFVNLNVASFLFGKLHVEEARFHLKEFLVVKNIDGKTNLESIKALQTMKSSGAAEKTGKKKAKKKTKVQVDNIALKINQVTYLSYDQDGAPKRKEFNINLDENYQNIKSWEAVVGLITVKALSKTTIASLTSFDVEGLNSAVSGSIGATKEAAEKIIGSTADTLKGTTDKLKETTGDLKGLLKNPFGDK